MLQVKAKRQHGHTGDADERQDAPWRSFKPLKHHYLSAKFLNHASTKDNAL
ncbi:hypothetical protein [Comamonas testosteroni]|uniref:hypothetical protein n=1 Tax=Comamonas testosteroni TaxID=285 RepID=UPI001F440025|nr:hypothetical protein [Comamonas testosteroni]